MAKPTSYWPYSTDAEINATRFTTPVNTLEEKRLRQKLVQYSDLKQNAYKQAKELRWVVIRKNTGYKDIVGIGLMPYGVAKAHLNSLGFNTNDSENMKEWKRSESFGSLRANPNDELLVQLHNELRMTPDTEDSDSIRINMGLEFTISPPYDEIYSRITNDDMILEEEYGTEPTEINPFMGVKSKEKAKLISWLPELALYLTEQDIERMVDASFGKMGGRRRSSQFDPTIRSEKKNPMNDKNMLLFPLDTGTFGRKEPFDEDEILYYGINRQVNATNSGQGSEIPAMYGFYGGYDYSMKNAINQDDRYGNQSRRNTSRNISFYEDFNNVARRNWKNSIPYYLPAVKELVREYGESIILPDDGFGGVFNIDVDYPLDLFGDEILSELSRERGNITKQVFSSVIRGFGYEPIDYYINTWEGKEPSYQTYLGDRNSGN
tara:strand:+ start:5922 stop:7226 length:1305 start_codon:yes stop_codon:yes gene_type:complete